MLYMNILVLTNQFLTQLIYSLLFFFNWPTPFKNLLYTFLNFNLDHSCKKEYCKDIPKIIIMQIIGVKVLIFLKEIVIFIKNCGFKWLFVIYFVPLSPQMQESYFDLDGTSFFFSLI